jgi:uncharacterized membrane protein YccC
MHRLFKSQTFYAVLAIPIGAFLLGFTFWNFHNTDPMWSIASFVLVYDPDMRTAMGAGLSRLAHTILGTLIAITSIYCFGLHKWLMPLSLAIGALICGRFLHFRNSWRVVLVTVSLVVGSSLLQPDAGLQIALTRALEVSVGSLLAIAFSWLVARFSSPPTAQKNP